jgi:hypothetical protein
MLPFGFFASKMRADAVTLNAITSSAQHMVPDDTESDIATRPHALTTTTRAENMDA